MVENLLGDDYDALNRLASAQTKQIGGLLTKGPSYLPRATRGLQAHRYRPNSLRNRM